MFETTRQFLGRVIPVGCLFMGVFVSWNATRTAAQTERQLQQELQPGHHILDTLRAPHLDLNLVVSTTGDSANARWLKDRVMESSRLVLDELGREGDLNCRWGERLEVMDVSLDQLNDPGLLPRTKAEQDTRLYGVTLMVGRKATALVAREAAASDTRPGTLETWGRERTVIHELAHYWKRTCAPMTALLFETRAASEDFALGMEQHYVDWLEAGQYASASAVGTVDTTTR